MSKILYIVRHAKSSHENQVRDWERPLMDVGVERANKISRLLIKKHVRPEKIVSSHAFRALNTAVIFALNLSYPVSEIEINYNIYEKTVDDIISLIKKQDDNISSLMIFGHNPVFTELYNELSGEHLVNLSTSAVAGIRFELDIWSKIHKKKGKSIFVETGK